MIAKLMKDLILFLISNLILCFYNMLFLIYIKFTLNLPFYILLLQRL